MRPTSCEISLSNVTKNVETLAGLVAPTPICAVVKANGYGHGAVPVARAAIDGGATWLAVAIVEEGVELREAGIDEPILVLSEQDATSLDALLEHGLTPSVYTSVGIERLDAVATANTRVHVLVDSGMRRIGAELDALSGVLSSIAQSKHLEVEAVWTHCPVADEPGNPFTDAQLIRFDAAVGVGLPTHVANSATAITRPKRQGFMVRCGISIYGIDPDPALSGEAPLLPAMKLRSEVTFHKTIDTGESVAYGHRWTADRPSTIVTVPIGYADGVRRDLGLRGGEVLIGGKRWPIVGVVTMDQLLVDVTGGEVAVGDEVVLIGAQGDDEITATEVAQRLDTIAYEVVCAVGARVPRTYV